MSSAEKAADAARTSLQRANTFTRSLASILSSPTPLAGPQNSSSSNLPPHTTSPNPTTSIQTTSQPQIRHNNPASPPAANPSTTTTVRTPVEISQLPHRQQPTSWQPVAARVHHRDDDVRNYCAPGSNGWAEWQERRVADSQAEIGRIDYSWNGGDVIDFAERRRLKRVRTAEWVDGLGEGHAEGEKREGGRMGCEGEEEGKAKGENWGEMEIREEAVMWQDINGTETDSEKDSETVKEKVWKEEEEDSFFKCLETMEKTEGQENDVLNECKREQDDENDDDEVSRSSSEIYPEWIGSWKNVVMASRAQVGSPAYRAAEEQLSGTRLSYHREGQI